MFIELTPLPPPAPSLPLSKRKEVLLSSKFISVILYVFFMVRAVLL